MRSRPGDVRGGGHEGPRGYRFEISAGNLALDLANTVDDRPTPDAEELLADYGRLVEWGRQSGAISAPQGRALLHEAERRAAAAAAALRRARETRETIFRVFSAIAHGRSASAADLDALNRALSASWAGARVTRAPDGYRLSWTVPDDDLDAVVRPAVRAAAELLVSGDLGRVRECAADACSWLFLDRSKSGTRRWCDMSLCGNRAKVRRHHAKLSGGAP